VRRWEVSRRIGRWVKLAPAGTYGGAEKPPRVGELLVPAQDISKPVAAPHSGEKA
jgi:hypothetical protein